jgi:hypothetical protein
MLFGDAKARVEDILQALSTQTDRLRGRALDPVA